VILAGGLSAQNVAEAIQAVRPFGVDVKQRGGGVPGVKDPDKIYEFVPAVPRRRIENGERLMSSTPSVDGAQSIAYPDAKGRYGSFGGRYVPEPWFRRWTGCKRSDAPLQSQRSKPSLRMIAHLGRAPDGAVLLAPALSRRWGGGVA